MYSRAANGGGAVHMSLLESIDRVLDRMAHRLVVLMEGTDRRMRSVNGGPGKAEEKFLRSWVEELGDVDLSGATLAGADLRTPAVDLEEVMAEIRAPMVELVAPAADRTNRTPPGTPAGR